MKVRFAILGRKHKAIHICTKKHEWVIKFNPFTIHKYSNTDK